VVGDVVAVAQLDVVQVRGRDDGDDARNPPGLAVVDLLDDRVRVRAADNGGVTQAGYLEIAGVAGGSGELGVAVPARHRPARWRRNRRCLPGRFGHSGSSRPAASAIASRIETYPVQRQMLPSR